MTNAAAVAATSDVLLATDQGRITTADRVDFLAVACNLPNKSGCV